MIEQVKFFRGNLIAWVDRPLFETLPQAYWVMEWLAELAKDGPVTLELQTDTLVIRLPELSRDKSTHTP